MTKLADETSLGTDPTLKSPDTNIVGRLPSAATPGSEVQVDDAGVSVCYANFCRVTGTPEELILDFGLNAQPMGAVTQIEVKQRLVTNYFTAKRLLHALGLSIQRHESAFGVLETDVQKRVMPALRRTATAG
jgi:Protein of unknown function (DUF3467)